MNLQGRTALVTGASSGIGVSFARQLAAAGAALILTARRLERLDELAAELREKHAVQVTTIPMDLSAPEAPEEAPEAIFAATEGAGSEVDVLINNAGVGTAERFDTIPWERSRQQLQLNVVSLTELTHRFLGPMLKRGRGHILNARPCSISVRTRLAGSRRHRANHHHRRPG